MKKKILLFVAIVLVICAAAAALAACNKAEETAPSDISRSVTSLYIADGDDFAVTVETGICEQPFIADGKVGETAEFATVTVTPLITLGAEELTFTLTGGGETPATLTGTLTSGGFGDFKGDIALSFVPEKVSVTADGKTFEATLTDVTAGKLSSADAVNIARELFAERIEDERAAGAPSREIYVKLVTGDREHFYYYVSFIGEGTDYWSVLVEPAGGAILSKR